MADCFNNGQSNSLIFAFAARRVVLGSSSDGLLGSRRLREVGRTPVAHLVSRHFLQVAAAGNLGSMP